MKKEFQNKLQTRERALIITSVLFVLSIFMGKWLFLFFTLIWLGTVGYCIYNMITRQYGSLDNFFDSTEKMGTRNIKEGRKIRGRIEQAMVPIFALGLFGIICALLSLFLS